MNERFRPEEKHIGPPRSRERRDEPPPVYAPPGKPPFLKPEKMAARPETPDTPLRTYNGQPLPPANILRARARAGKWDTDVWIQQMIDAGFAKTDQDKQMSRRAFLKGAGAATIVTIAGVGVLDHFYFKNFAKFLDERTGAPQYDYDAAIKEARAFMKKIYNVDLVVGVNKEEDKDIEARHAGIERCRQTMQVLVEEIRRYPPEMVQKIGDRRGFEIRIVDTLSATHVDKEGKKQEWEYGGIAPFLKDGKPASLILRTQELEQQQRTNFHHEMNHRFTNRFQNYEERNEQWVEMHKEVPHAAYIGYKDARDGNEYAAPAYFLRRYAQAAPVEDQAVCAENALVPRQHIYFLQLLDSLPPGKGKRILQAKYNETLANYFDWSGGKMDKKYWEHLISEGKKNSDRVIQAQK